MGEAVSDPDAANARRTSVRKSQRRACNGGCLGCSEYKNSKGYFYKCKETVKATTVKNTAMVENSFSDYGTCRKKRSIEDIYNNGPSNLVKKKQRVPEPSPYDDLVCTICKKGEGDSEMLLCDCCDQGFHMYCLCPILVKVPRGIWFCPLCSKKEGIADFPLVQTKIVDFFHIQKSLAISSEARRRRGPSLCMYKKKRRFLPFVPSKDHARRLQQMASLATALTNTNVEFSDELTYHPGLALESANRASFERGGMQVIGKEDLATLNLCKLMSSRGELPPLMVTHDMREGFVVEADGFIKDLTLIAEYTGDVDYMQNRLHDDSDNLMALLFSDDLSKELVICPDKKGNIARFISGINNHTLEGRKKQNLRCVRYDVNGQIRVLLVAIRDIAKGERLYYDYNAYYKEYPTQHFV